MKLAGALVAFVLLVVVAPAPAGASVLPPGGTFFDDDGNIHEGTIEAIAALGITKGCGVVDLFCPGDAVTRGQIAAFLVRALHLPPSSDDMFTDDNNSIFEANIQALAAAGITRGCGDHRYCPDDNVTRGQMAAFLVRALHLAPSSDDVFADDDNSIFEADIQALAAAGITFGCLPYRYCPEGLVLRDQMASFLARALDLDPVSVPPRPTRILAFTGDTLIHMPVTSAAAANGDNTGQPYDYLPMFTPVASIISDADLAICHLEVPLSPTDTGLSGYPRFNAPRELADDLAAAGFDGCSTASNHALDQGTDGLLSTLDILDEAGLAHAGTASSADGTQATMYDVDGVTIAHLSATWSTNGLAEPADQPWLVQDIDVNSLIAKAEAAKRDGADFVVVSVHCCVEYQTLPTSSQIDTDRRLIESPAIDLVIGHHAHVVQPIERWNDEYIVYGLGNFLSAQHHRTNTADGVIVLVELTERNDQWVVRKIDFVPTYVTVGDYRILPAAETIAAGAGSLASTLLASWNRTVDAIETYNPPGVAPVTEP